MIEVKCDRFWFPEHNWEKWENIESGIIRGYDRFTEMFGTVGYYVLEKRRCANCGKTEIRKTKT